MRTIKIALALLTLTACSGRDTGLHSTQKLGALLTAQTLASSRSFSLTESQLRGYAVLSVMINFTYNAATAITMSCTGNDGVSASAFIPQSCDTANGVCTATDASFTKAVSASKILVYRVNIVGFNAVTCTIAGTGGGASDLITVNGTLSTF